MTCLDLDNTVMGCSLYATGQAVPPLDFSSTVQAECSHAEGITLPGVPQVGHPSPHIVSADTHAEAQFQAVGTQAELSSPASS